PTITSLSSAVLSGLTTNTEEPCWPLCTAEDGTTIAFGSVASVVTTLTNCPGHRRRRSFLKDAFTRMVPVVGSTALSTNVIWPSDGGPSPDGGLASTWTAPFSRYAFSIGSCASGMAKL